MVAFFVLTWQAFPSNSSCHLPPRCFSFSFLLPLLQRLLQSLSICNFHSKFKFTLFSHLPPHPHCLVLYASKCSSLFLFGIIVIPNILTHRPFPFQIYPRTLTLFSRVHFILVPTSSQSLLVLGVLSAVVDLIVFNRKNGLGNEKTLREMNDSFFLCTTPSYFPR